MSNAAPSPSTHDPASTFVPPPKGRRNLALEKATTYLLISLICAGPTCFFTFFSLFGSLISHDGFPTCNEGSRNHLFCSVVLVPPVLSLLTFLFDVILLLQLGKLVKESSRMGPSPPGLPTFQDERRVDETTPLLGAGTTGTVLEPSQDPSSPTKLPAGYHVWTWLFVALWGVLAIHALINALLEVAPGTTWKPSDAWTWCLLVPLHLVQLWMLSITAVELSMAANGATLYSTVDKSSPTSRLEAIQYALVVSLVLLPLSLVFSEAQLPFLRLFLVTLLVDFAALLALDVHIAFQRTKPVPSSPHVRVEGGEGDPEPFPFSRDSPTEAHIRYTLPQRLFFATASASALMLSFTWVAWSSLTLVAATLSLLRDAFPGWNIVRLPIPPRGWAMWVWLEAVVDIWQGWALGREFILRTVTAPDSIGTAIVKDMKSAEEHNTPAHEGTEPSSSRLSSLSPQKRSHTELDEGNFCDKCSPSKRLKGKAPSTFPVSPPSSPPPPQSPALPGGASALRSTEVTDLPTVSQVFWQAGMERIERNRRFREKNYWARNVNGWDSEDEFLWLNSQAWDMMKTMGVEPAGTKPSMRRSGPRGALYKTSSTQPIRPLPQTRREVKAGVRLVSPTQCLDENETTPEQSLPTKPVPSPFPLDLSDSDTTPHSTNSPPPSPPILQVFANPEDWKPELSPSDISRMSDRDSGYSDPKDLRLLRREQEMMMRALGIDASDDEPEEVPHWVLGLPNY